MGNNTLYKIISYHWFVLKLGWKISKRRVLLEFLDQMLIQLQRIVYSCVVIQVILDMAVHRQPFAKVVCLLWGILMVHGAISMFDSYFQTMVLPVTDVALCEGINQLLCGPDSLIWPAMIIRTFIRNSFLPHRMQTNV